MNDIDKREFHRQLINAITDDMLTCPVHELSSAESAMIEAVFRGPLAGELLERLDNLNKLQMPEFTKGGPRDQRRT